MSKAAKSRVSAKTTKQPPRRDDRRSATPLPNPNADGLTQAEPGPLAAWTYQVDLWQRWWLVLDTLRERGDNMLEHERAGQPPLLAFEYETILDAREFEHPANYALLRVTGANDAGLKGRRRNAARPVIVVDPRAGHGPGIGGFGVISVFAELPT